MLVNETEGSNGVYIPGGSTRAPAFINSPDPISRCYYLIKIIVEATLVTSPTFKELVLNISLQSRQQTKTSTIKISGVKAYGEWL